MAISIESNLTKDELYDFAIYNTYSKINGFLLIVIGISINLIGLIGKFYFNFENWKVMAYIIVGIIVISYTPLYIKYKINKLPNDASIFKRKKYYISDKGIFAGEFQVGWDKMTRYVKTTKNIGLYFGEKEVIILPIKDIKGSYKKINKIIVINIDIDKISFT